MKKGQVYEGVVESVQFPSKGIVTQIVDGEGNAQEEKAVVKHVIPGQKISFRVSKKRKGKVEGNCLEILEKAQNEITPDCPHFGQCGGCVYRQLSYEDQLKLKESQVQKILDEVYIKISRTVDYQFEGIKASPKYVGYRNKMEFSFGDSCKDGPLELGLHKRGSFYDIVSVDQCQIVDDDYRLILKTTLDYFKGEKTDFYHRMKQTGYLRHLLVRKTEKTGQILVALVASDQYTRPDGKDSKSERELLRDFRDALLTLQREEKLQASFAGIIHIVNTSVADVIKVDGGEVWFGKDFFYEELMGLQFKISLFSFFQTNTLGAELLYETARDYIGESSLHKTVFDLYSGTGTIAQMMAEVADKVVGVEIVEEAVEAAKVNAELNGLHNCEFIAGDVLKVLDDVEEKPDFIVLDPPRDGIHPKALQKIIDYGVDHLVYISCKPTSLARDLEVFLEHGYKMDRACAVDMFPATANVETVALLSKV